MGGKGLAVGHLNGVFDATLAHASEPFDLKQFPALIVTPLTNKIAVKVSEHMVYRSLPACEDGCRASSFFDAMSCQDPSGTAILTAFEPVINGTRGDE